MGTGEVCASSGHSAVGLHRNSLGSFTAVWKMLWGVQHSEEVAGSYPVPAPGQPQRWCICLGTSLSLECPALSWCPTEFPSTYTVSGTCLPQMHFLGSPQPLILFFQCISLNQSHFPTLKKCFPSLYS